VVDRLRRHAPAFDELMGSQTFVRAIAELQSIHMNWLYRMVEDATLHSTRARVTRRLLLLTSGDVTTWPQNRQNVSVSQETLAMMLGITRQTLSLELRAMTGKRSDRSPVWSHRNMFEGHPHILQDCS
jgi:CRP/FNR family cyclic AMP-dependent transcriptional regulator